MTERKFTDEQIIKALECCRDFGDCSLCPYEKATFSDELDCTERLHTDALDLINRQRAEIERLMLHKNLIASENELHKLGASELVLRHRTEAIKEFAESMKKRERSNAYCCFCAHATIYGDRAKECDEPYIDKNGKEQKACFAYAKFESYIDKFVKEMTEGGA